MSGGCQRIKICFINTEPVMETFKGTSQKTPEEKFEMYGTNLIDLQVS